VSPAVPTATQGPISTLKPTNTPRPTNTYTPKPTYTRGPTNTPPKTREEIRSEFVQLWADYLPVSVSDVETITTSRINNGRLEIELKTMWASEDRQANVSYEIIQALAEILVDGMPPKTAAEIVGSDEFIVDLVTYSTNGDYRYESTTNYDTLLKVHNKSITYDEWVATSNAGFR
jgi:hypothetical protein